MKRSMISIAVGVWVVSNLYAGVTGDFKGVSFWATDGGRKFEVSGGTGVLKNEKDKVVAEGKLGTVDEVLCLDAKKGSTFTHKAGTAAFGADAFPKNTPKTFAEVEYAGTDVWTIKDGSFLFVLEVPALSTPQIKVDLDKSLARASIIHLPQGTYTLWGNEIEVEEGGGTVKVQAGTVIEHTNAKPARDKSASANKETTAPAAKLDEYRESDLPFEAQLSIAKGGGFSDKVEGGVIKHSASGVTIAALSLGGKDIALLSTNVTADAMILTKDFGKLGVKINHSTFSCSVLVTAKQEAELRKLLPKKE
mgnify:CR=1 FL=1